MIDQQVAQKYRHQAEMLGNRVKKRFKHLYKRYARQNIDAFRLYDWDIPEIRAAVDWYAGHLVVAEYTRRQSTPEWLPMMGAAAAAALDVPLEKVHLKQRFTGGGDGNRYERLDTTDEKIVVSEGDLSFYVNLNDYVDTGLFSDHRNTRRMVREMAPGCDFLNLYCYTGTFSCYAAAGGARRTVSVDRSETAVQWARENMALNGIPEEGNALIQADTFDFLERAGRGQQTFDLAVVDPPSFSTSRGRPAESGWRLRCFSRSPDASECRHPADEKGCRDHFFHQPPEFRTAHARTGRRRRGGNHLTHHPRRLREQTENHSPVLEDCRLRT